MKEFANTSNRGRVCLFYRNETTITSLAICTVRVSTSFTLLLPEVRKSTAATASGKTMITSTHNLPLSSLKVESSSRFGCLE